MTEKFSPNVVVKEIIKNWFSFLEKTLHSEFEGTSIMDNNLSKGLL